MGIKRPTGEQGQRKQEAKQPETYPLFSLVTHGWNSEDVRCYVKRFYPESLPIVIFLPRIVTTFCDHRQPLIESRPLFIPADVHCASSLQTKRNIYRASSNMSNAGCDIQQDIRMNKKNLIRFNKWTTHKHIASAVLHNTTHVLKKAMAYVLYSWSPAEQLTN